MFQSRRNFTFFFKLCGFLLCGGAQAQLGSNDGEWTNYASDTGSTKYTSLDQINAEILKSWKSSGAGLLLTVRSILKRLWETLRKI
ncbi:MAG: hypothetical protein Ct9H300mP22_5820 [Gammaproteobacteria bacterium]|nr:MAG: hypothetical protein Ct9H300mP22_5820 [Gammaproteobacteria bacterium]